MIKRVLIVEDNAVIAMELKHDLMKIGYQVIGISHTGEDALLLAVTSDIDIVIMDIRLSGRLDGIETAEIMSRDFDLPVVYLTAHSDPQTFERVKSTNPHGYLIKPFDIAVLNSTLEIAIHKASAEKKLKESENLFRTLVESSHDGIFIIQNSEIVYANDAFAESVGLPTESIKGEKFTQFFTPDDHALILDTVDKKLRGVEAAKHIEVKARHAQGQDLYFSLCLSVINYKGFVSVMGTTKDITLMKQREFELIKSKEEIQRSDYLKSEFIGLISHEIRTPINIIHGFISILSDDLNGGYNELQSKALAKIAAASDKLVESAGKIIEYSEITTNSYHLNKQEMVIDDEIIESLVFDYTMKAHQKGIKLFYNNFASQAKIFGDKEMIKKLVANLIDNAVKYTNEGIIQINQMADTANKVVLEIADTGPGMENTYIQNLFHSENWSDASPARSYDGNGLGLTMVRRYADLNNITVQLLSTKGKGTIAKVVFN